LLHVSTLSHELRNPLAPISNNLQILRKSSHDDSTEEVRNMTDRQLTPLVRLIDDLPDVSCFSQGKIDLRKEKITLQSVLEAAIETSRPLIEANKHTLTLNIPKDALWVSGDAARLAHVISHLLNNAAKYTPQGGKVTLSVHQENEEAILTVADNGIGIAGNMLPKVFELLTQADRAPDRSQGGLGIGLALVKHLVEMHNGKIWAQSPGHGKGSTFILHLPLATDTQKTTATEPAKNDASTIAPLRVLVVDDNLASAQITTWMLELIGHQPSMVHNGLEAVDVARKTQPDIMLLDIGLPGLNGYEVCRELRNDPLMKDTIFIALTGWGQERDRQLAREAGFDHHLLKPMNFEKFSGLLADITAK
jgi:CheY-like chemotaxis protein